MDYYTIIIITTLMALLFMLTVTIRNKNIDAKKRTGFIALYIMIFVATFCEWLGTFLTGFSNNLIYLYKFSKFLELSITPIFTFVCAKLIFSTPKKSKCTIYVFITLLVTHTILEFLSMFYGFIFYIDNKGYYHHMKFYIIYIFVFIITGFYFFIKVFMFSKYYQSKDIPLLFIIALFITFGLSIQLVNYELKTAWLTIAISSIFMYIYYSQLTMYVDNLTQLLNQNSYKHHLKNCNYPVTILIFDINNFKNINDTLGHSFGDYILSIIGKTIKEVFGPYGYCFRIGGDEFSVFLKNNTNISDLCNTFNEKIDVFRKTDPNIPTVSIGSARFTPGYDDIRDIVQIADRKMYDCKEQLKKGFLNPK